MIFRWCAFLLGALVCFGLTSCSGGDRITLQGTGATFPAPLYQQWFQDYGKKHKDVRINYQAKGSGAGISDFKQGLVDFAASDAAMKDEEIKEIARGVQLLPVTAGSIVLSYNLPDFKGELKLSRDAYIGIFLGKITKWNDEKIKADNPGVELPDLKISVIRRADGSGTTYVFTQHLAAISAEWKAGPGVGTTVEWPKDTIGGKGSDGVTALIKQTPGAIGYIEYGYAEQTKLPTALLQNKAGAFVKASMESGQAALAGAEMPSDLRAWVPDPQGKDAYPIVTFTWILLYKKYDDAKKLEALKEIFKFCLTDGQKDAGALGYIPLPKNAVDASLKALDGLGK